MGKWRAACILVLRSLKSSRCIDMSFLCPSATPGRGGRRPDRIPGARGRTVAVRCGRGKDVPCSYNRSCRRRPRPCHPIFFGEATDAGRCRAVAPDAPPRSVSLQPCLFPCECHDSAVQKSIRSLPSAASTKNGVEYDTINRSLSSAQRRAKKTDCWVIRPDMIDAR